MRALWLIGLAAGLGGSCRQADKTATLPARASEVRPAVTVPAVAKDKTEWAASTNGWVIELPDGEFGLFAGLVPFRFPRDAQAPLEDYVGQFVRVDYTRRDLRPEKPSRGRAESQLAGIIVRIDKVTVLANRPDDLPVSVELTPTKGEYTVGEPIEVTVRIENNSWQVQRLSLAGSGTTLWCDSKPAGTLEDPDQPAAMQQTGNLADAHALAPGETVDFRITSQFMAEPGTYQVAYHLPLLPAADGRSLTCLSEYRTVKVLPPAEGEDANLSYWLTHGNLEQRVALAEQLYDLRQYHYDANLLSLLESGDLPLKGHTDTAAFRYAWHLGGRQGSELMLKLIDGEKRQTVLANMIAGVPLAPNRLDILARLLGDVTETIGDVAGWCERPRVCDLTAAWLAGYTDGRLEFPRNAPPNDRDAAVGAVKATLKDAPAFFSVFGPDPDDALASSLAGTRDAHLPGYPIVETRISPGVMPAVLQLKHLRRATGRCANIDDQALVGVGSLKELQELDVWGANRVGDDGLKEISQVTSLRRLNICSRYGNPYTDAGVAQLAGLANLEALDLSASQTTDAGLAQLANLTKMRELNLAETKITDAGLAHLEGMADLRTLNLHGTATTDKGLTTLAGLKNLKTLTVGREVTEEGLKSLRTALPTTRIQGEGD